MAHITPIVNVLKERVKEADKALGGLTDAHLKWLLVYVRERLGAAHANFLMDFKSTPRRITVTPYKHDRIVYSKLEWLKIRFKLWRSGDEKDMPQFLDLGEWEIKFTRLAQAAPTEEQ